MSARGGATLPRLWPALLGRTSPPGSLSQLWRSLRDTEERRRQTKAGFGTRKDCQAAMNKLLVAVEQQTTRRRPRRRCVSTSAGSGCRPSRRGSGPAPTTPTCSTSSVTSCPISAAQAPKLSGSQVERPLRDSGRERRQGRQDTASRRSPSTTSTPACTRPARTPSGGDSSAGTRSTQLTHRGPRPTARGRCRPGTPSSSAPSSAQSKDDRLYALWHLIAMTGMRRGEALGLRWSDVDLENARLAVRRALIPTNREVVVSEPKTAKGRRVVALDPVTVEVLKGQAARQLEEQRRVGRGLDRHRPRVHQGER